MGIAVDDSVVVYTLGDFFGKYTDAGALDVFRMGATATLHHAEDHLAIVGFDSRTFLRVRVKVCFVDFNHSCEQITVRGHELADVIEHALGSLVGDAQLGFKLFSTYTGTGLCHELDSVEPELELGAGVVEDRAFEWIDMVAAE